MDVQYSLYAIMHDGSRYILKFDEYFYQILKSLISGNIEKNSIDFIQSTSLTKELYFLYKLSNNECKYLMIKNKENKTIIKIKPNQLK